MGNAYSDRSHHKQFKHIIPVLIDDTYLYNFILGTNPHLYIFDHHIGKNK